jgi:hydrogenase maturation protein HypF
MELESAAAGADTEARYRLNLTDIPGEGTRVDWAPMIHSIIEDANAGVTAAVISAKFHNALAEAIVEVARVMGRERVVLSGGCFQNKYLTEKTLARLSAAGFQPYWHQHIPPNDGGLALGQLAALAAERTRGV